MIDAYVWKETGVRQALLNPPRFLKPSFLAKIEGVDGLWDLSLEKNGMVRIVLGDRSYGLSKRVDGGYGVTVKKGKEESTLDADAPEALEFLKALEAMLNAYASQIEQGIKVNKAREKLRDTILKRRSPEQ